MRTLFGVALAVVGASQVTACRADEAAATIIKSVGVEDARGFLTQSGVEVQKVDFDHDSFTITAAISSDRHVWFEGMNCKGEGKAMACPEFKISAGWDLDTPARAEAMAKVLNYNYTSVHADGANLDLWRMDFIPGGVTREHIRLAVAEFLELRNQAENEIYPPDGSAQRPNTSQK